MDSQWRDRSLALAGICQAVSLVDQLARTGYLKTEAFETAVNSLFVTHPNNTEEVFGSTHQLTHGFEQLIELSNHHKDKNNANTLRYFLGVVHLQKRLARRSDMLYIISNRLEAAERQSKHFGPSHDNVVANIAEIYTDTISKFPYRIQVVGDQGYLHQTRVASQVRVLLLAAIRSAMLWRQNKGSRIQLLFQRSKVVEAAESLLKESQSETLH